MTVEIGIVIVIIILTLYLLITEKFGIDTVSIIAMILLMVTGVLTPTEGFAGFTNSATITVACMFVVSAAIYKSGALSSAGNILITLSKKSYFLTVLALMLITGTLSAFMNDTAVVAILFPVVMSVARKSKINPSRLLMPLSFGALLGGICTLIGTSTNILVSGIAEREGLPPIGMFEMAPAGICFLIVGILYMLFIGSRLLPDRKQNEDLSEEYGMNQYFTEIILLSDAKSIGTSIKNSALVKILDIQIVQIKRNGVTFSPYPDFILAEYDVLKVVCDIDKLKLLMDRAGIVFESEKKLEKKNTLPTDIILLEALVTPNSDLENHSIKSYNFRMRFEGATVLAIRQREEILHDKLGRVILKAGDVLLISTKKDQLPLFKNNNDLLIISEIEHRPFNWKKMIAIIAIVAGIVITAALNTAPIMLSATVGVAAMVALNFLKTEEAYKAIDWKVIFMLAGILSLGVALEKTGAAAFLAQGIVNTVGSWGPEAVLSVFFGLTFLSTNIMSNNATAALLTPIAIVTAQNMSVDSRPFILAVAFAASLSFMTPMSYQTNAMIYAPGKYKFKDYLRVGTPLNMILWILASIIIPYFYPF